MQYDVFKAQIKDTFQEMMGAATPVTISPVLKNNNIHLDALTIMPEGAIATPTIYLNDYYTKFENGMPMNSIIEEISEIYESSRNGFVVNEEVINDYEKAKKIVSYRLINYEENLELLATIPHKKVLDLAEVYYMIIDSGEQGEATALITNDHMALWGVTKTKLRNQARRNAPKLLPSEFQSLESMMLELVIADLKSSARNFQIAEDLSADAMLSDDTFEMMAKEMMSEYQMAPQDYMHVLTNEKRFFGASAITYPGLLAMIAEELGSFYILPSSIHEVILIPASEDTNPRDLLDMVKDVNEKEVSPLERLSDSIYFYNKESTILSVSNMDTYDLPEEKRDHIRL